MATITHPITRFVAEKSGLTSGAPIARDEEGNTLISYVGQSDYPTNGFEFEQERIDELELYFTSPEQNLLADMPQSGDDSDNAEHAFPFELIREDGSVYGTGTMYTYLELTAEQVTLALSVLKDSVGYEWQGEASGFWNLLLLNGTDENGEPLANSNQSWPFYGSHIMDEINDRLEFLHSDGVELKGLTYVGEYAQLV